MVEVIKQKLNEYLEFDSDELFWGRHVDLAAIFGGSLRDIVAGDSDKINDIDIIGLPVSLGWIRHTLELNGYTQMELVKPDIFTIYKDINYIFEPITYMNNNHKIVQLIRPHNQNLNAASTKFTALKNNYYKLLSNVDLTSSGLFYDGKNLYESIRYSFIHCKMKVYEMLPDAMMYDLERTDKRIHKLRRTKNWKQFNPDDKLKMRQIKINQINNDFNVLSLDDYINNTMAVTEIKEK